MKVEGVKTKQFCKTSHVKEENRERTKLRSTVPGGDRPENVRRPFRRAEDLQERLIYLFALFDLNLFKSHVKVLHTMV